jgi:hypothetical protein
MAVFVVLSFPWKINLYSLRQDQKTGATKGVSVDIQRLPLPQKRLLYIINIMLIPESSPKLYQVHGTRTCPMTILKRLSNVAIYSGLGGCKERFVGENKLYFKSPG